MKKLNFSRICLFLGIGLLALGVVLLICWQWGLHTSAQRAEDYVQRIRTRIPQPQGAVLEERRENGMPVLSLEGRDFIGLLEMPAYGLSLPVCGTWGQISQYPCRLGGSVYDRSIQIGATSQKGQLDFYRQISLGDRVYFTDMEGNRFSYEVTGIRYEKHADQAALCRQESDLTLFVQNIYGLEYIVIFCTAA